MILNIWQDKELTSYTFIFINLDIELIGEGLVYASKL